MHDWLCPVVGSFGEGISVVVVRCPQTARVRVVYAVVVALDASRSHNTVRIVIAWILVVSPAGQLFI